MRFLIVDDSPTSRKLTMTALRTFGYNDSIEAEDGVQALKVLKSQKVDIMITDWNMPNLNGLELTNIIRADKDLKEMPIIICSTRGQKDDILSAIKSRVNGYIVKPFTPITLKDKVSPVIERYKKRKDPESVNKDLPINISFDSKNLKDYNHISLTCSMKEGKEILSNSNININLLKNNAIAKRITSTLIIENNKAIMKLEAIDRNDQIIDSQEIELG